MHAHRRWLPGRLPGVPAVGEPGLDTLSVHDEVERGAAFAPYAGYGCQAMLDCFVDDRTKAAYASVQSLLDAKVYQQAGARQTC